MTLGAEPGGRGRRVVATALLGSVLAPLNSTMIIVALPSILHDLDAPLTWGSWIVISYLVAMAAVQPLGGTLGDRYGRRRLLLLGLGGFFVASVAAALAPSIAILVAARTAQAIAGAIAIPNATALVRSLVHPARQGRAFGIIAAGLGVAAASGPPLGGLVTEALGWRWLFLANVLVLVPGIALALALPRRTTRAVAARFDLTGAALLLGALVALALAATLWRVDGAGALASALLAIIGAAATVALARHVPRVAAPILDPALLQQPTFLAAGLTVLTTNATMYTIFLAVPVFMAQVVGWGARDIGLLLAGMSVLMVVCGPIGGSLADRLGPRLPAMLGSGIAALGTVFLLWFHGDGTWPLYLLPLVVVGTGIGLASAPVQSAAMQAVPPEEAGGAAGVFSTMRYLGSVAGSAAMAAVLGEAAGVPAFRTLFALLLLASIAAMWSSSRLPGGVRRAVRAR